MITQYIVHRDPILAVLFSGQNFVMIASQDCFEIVVVRRVRVQIAVDFWVIFVFGPAVTGHVSQVGGIAIVLMAGIVFPSPEVLAVGSCLGRKTSLPHGAVVSCVDSEANTIG